jgi:hypothetical protein
VSGDHQSSTTKKETDIPERSSAKYVYYLPTCYNVADQEDDAARQFHGYSRRCRYSPSTTCKSIPLNPSSMATDE